VLRQVAEGVLIHESEFCQSNAVVVQGRAGVLLIDPGVLGSELAAEQVTAVLPELGEARLRDGLARLARSAARDAGQGNS
jgi:glyoxylase-like metal-dependent hydrolase (beta-lactamase superfamily II)